MTTENKSPLLTDIEAAALFGVSRPTLWRWRNGVTGFPQPIRVGARSVRYRRADLLAYIASANPAK